MIRCLSDIERLESYLCRKPHRSLQYDEFAPIDNSTSSLANFVMSQLINIV